MPRKLLPHVERYRDRHGKIRYYFRVGKGPRTALPLFPESETFRLAWQECLEGRAAFKPLAFRPDIPGSISALITSYRASAAFMELRASTKVGYGSRIEHLRRAHGHRLVRQMSRQGIEAMVLAPYAGKPGARHAALKMLRILIKHAIQLGWLRHDPSVGIKRPKLGEIRRVTEAEIKAFYERWPLGTKERTAFDLLLCTGQRVSDVRRMTWRDIAGDAIDVVQQKTGVKLKIKLHADLQATLRVAARDNVAIIVTAYGKPFSEKGFGQWLRKAFTAAGLPLDCQPHGLRKAAACRLADAGCSATQIMAVTGHRSLAEAERYVRQADQERLARAGIELVENARRTNLPKPDEDGLGSKTKNARKSK